MSYDPTITPYEYIGDVSALGSLQLTMLARSFETMGGGELEDLFPDRNINERTIVVEQIIEGLGLMPLVKPATQTGAYIEPDRIRTFRVEPLYVRQNDFLDQFYINQLRKAGTMNDQLPVLEHIQSRVQKIVAEHQRTKDFFRAQTLLGGASYVDPRTNVPISYSTNIPKENFFAYNGFNATVAANTSVTVAGATMTTARALVNDTGRTEAYYFQSTDGRVAVPFTDPKSDITKALNYIKHYLFRTNKNRFTELVMSSDLLTVIMETELIKQAMNRPAVLVNNPNAATAINGTTSPVPGIVIGPDGNLASIAGLRIRLVDGIYRDPVSGQITTYWPAHKIALVAPRSYQDPSATLGITQHCVGESPDGQPGFYIRTADHLNAAPPPAPPGLAMQAGDAFMPFAVYPHWIALLDVCEPEDLSNSIILRANLGFGVF